MKRFPSVFLAIAPLLAMIGCHKSESNILPASSLAQSDPNARGAELLKDCRSLDSDERTAYIQQHSFDFKVFEKVTDPKLKSEYDSEIKPKLTNP